MASLCLVDLGMSGVYVAVSRDAPPLGWLLVKNLLILGVLNVLVADRLFRPVAALLEGGGKRAAARRAVDRLPFASAVWAFVLACLYCPLVFSLGTFTPRSDLLDAVPIETRAFALVWFTFLYAVYYSFYVYFLISDFAITLRLRLNQEFAIGAEPRRGRLRRKLAFVFGVLALVPNSHLVLDLTVLRELRDAQGLDVTDTVMLDLFATLLVLGVALVFVARSLLRPVDGLTETVRRIRRGELETRAPIITNDEIGVLTGAVNRMLEGLRERAFIRETFGKYVPESVAAAIVEGRAPIDPKITTATILFADIEGFTNVAEQMSPRALVESLNEYFSAVIEPVQRYSGTVNQFQGDALLVTFNVPVADEIHADHAVAAALAIVETVRERRFGGVSLRTRIGINTGLVFAGNVGSGDRYNYTVHGDAVNLASRLEALNKELGTRVLVASSTVDLLTEPHPLARYGDVTVRGRDEKVTVYTIEESVPGRARSAE